MEVKSQKQSGLDLLNPILNFKKIQKMSGELPNGDTLNVLTPNAGFWEFNDKTVPFTFNEDWVTFQ
mgnify:CR=1 FL=1|tara:strand:+ start:6949 stop:7146 length:198 start_codon:yes stop_codon:yes gene_type:complete